MHTNIRKWGNSAGTIIPAPVLAEAGLSLGDAVEIEAVEGKIVISQAAPRYNLDDLLRASPTDSITLDEEDKAWIHDESVGREIG